MGVISVEGSDMTPIITEVGDGVIVVDFYASWCGPCRSMVPVFEEFAVTFAGKAKFVKVDVDQAETLVTEYQVKAMPTFVIIKNGVKVDELIGASRDKLLAMIKRHVEPAET
eukprot:TRINITY_DN6086_c0_g1_i2.p2 TRINITY_DN6086_c0_g1~~TRINITY_DN6086_c0_g1_i2.p2  ORF type:complete len:112 (-),score=14.28 TRINITY_DN6086_c0_g1_i2:547-882(-)